MTGVRLTKRGFLVNVILYLSFITLYYVFRLFIMRHVLGSSDEAYQMVNAFFNFTIAIAVILSVFFIQAHRKIHIIYGFSVATLILTIPLLLTFSIILRLMLIFALGIFFGIGMLAFFAYFWDLTVSEERGRTAGFIGFLALPINFVIISMAETFDFFGAVILVIILSSGIMAVKLLKPRKKAMLTTKKDERGNTSEKRTILLYSIPWALFSLINATLASSISIQVFQRVDPFFYMILTSLQTMAAVFGALGGGIIADFFGRRPSLVFSLTLYGIGSALVGITQSYEALYLAYVANGLNWGILWVIYAFVIWGDLANRGNCAKRYAIGMVIFYVATGIGSLLTVQTSQISLVVSSLASCLLIFLSNVPLILAPELLPLAFREKIKVKLYMNTVEKIGRKLSRSQG
jgi:hypothetical protein